MSKTLNNLKELEKYINQQASKALKREVAKAVTEEISSTIKEVEYPKYVSSAENPYERNMDDGGLSDVRLMQVEVLDDNTISVTNERMDGSVDVTRIFATGIGYKWKNSEIYGMQPFPRDFYADTIEILKRNKNHVIAMKEGLKRLGLKVE